MTSIQSGFNLILFKSSSLDIIISSIHNNILKMNRKIHPEGIIQDHGVIETQPNCFVLEAELSNAISFRCAHISFFLCWIGLILAGTTVIGVGTTNYFTQFKFCNETEEFCSYDITLTQNHNLSMYSKLSPFYQNNRLYLDSFSLQQLHGEIGNATFCQSYSTFKQLQVTETSGGYRIKEDNFAHPCGYTMKTLYNDQFYIVSSQGSTPDLDTNLYSNFSKIHHFKRLNNSQTTQWVDVESSRFINWFTIPFTSTKYVKMGYLEMQAGDYQFVIRNSYPTNEDFTKTVIFTEINKLGMTNHILGYAIFGYGIIILLLHVFICCKSKV